MRTLAALILFGVLASAQTGWKLVWSDEFNGAAGSPPNPANWNYDLGGGGWGNGELEVYSNSSNNVFQDGKGNLVIQVLKDAQGNYTSTRLQTGKPGSSAGTADLSWQYGRVEARIKLPYGLGVWPAFWMLGESIGTLGWPRCGEIDIMENFGTFHNNASVNNGTIHGPANSSTSPPDYPPSGIGTSTTLPFGETVYDDYHVYAIEWAQDSVKFFLDGKLYQTLTPASLPTGAVWEFNAPFFILLNVAIGGPKTFLGTPNSSVTFPQQMLVDYVRVYQAVQVEASTPVITPGSVVNSASFLGDLSPGGLATLTGTNLADAEHLIAAPDTGGTFPVNVAGVSVTVNGVAAPLIYVSPGQINFQIPWETQPAPAVDVVVNRNMAASEPETVTIANAASPSMFLEDSTNGVAWMTGTGCELSECSAEAGTIYQLWANGLGPKNAPQQDGAPAIYSASLTPLEAADGCKLTIGGQPATVTYCGAAPGLIIDQLNFSYPPGVPIGAYAEAVLTIDGATGLFRLPAPAQ